MTLTLRHTAIAIVVVLATALLSGVPASAHFVWQPSATDVSAPGGTAIEAEIAVDATGNLTAVWSRGDATGYRTQATTRAAGGAWSAPVYLSAGGAGNYEPRLVVDPAGNATAVWVRSAGGGAQVVQAATRTAGGTWSAPTDISGADVKSSASVTVDGGGNVTVVWVTSDQAVQQATRSPGGAWTAPSDVAATGGIAARPDVAAAPGGEVTAVWIRADVAGAVVLASSRPADGAWTAPAPLGAVAQEVGSPVVAVDATGNATATWAEHTLSASSIQAAERPVGGTWTTGASISGTDERTEDPHLVLDPDGNATAVWVRRDLAGTYIVRAASRPFRGEWTAPVDLSAAVGDAGDPEVAVDDAGTATAAWRHDDGTNQVIQVSALPIGGTWSTPVDLSTSGEDARGPQLALAPSGDAIAAWSRRSGDDEIVQARVLDGTDPVVTGLRGPVTGHTGQELTFAADATDMWSRPAVTWDLGDGTHASGPSIRHTFGTAGAYTIRLTATDSVGHAVTRTITTTISRLPRPRIRSFALSRSVVSLGGRPRTTKALLRLNTPARVTFTFISNGARTRTLTQALPAGTSRTRLVARTLRLRPGRYTVTVRARNSTGRSARVRTRLTVRR